MILLRWVEFLSWRSGFALGHDMIKEVAMRWHCWREQRTSHVEAHRSSVSGLLSVVLAACLGIACCAVLTVQSAVACMVDWHFVQALA